MAGAFTVGTLQNALGSVIGGVAGNSGGNYFEKHTSAGLSNSAADYRTKGVSLYEAYASKMSAAEVVAIRRDLAKGEVALERRNNLDEDGSSKPWPWTRWRASRAAKDHNRAAFRLVRKLSEKARVEDPNIRPASESSSTLTPTSVPTVTSTAGSSVPSVTPTAETNDPFKDPSRWPVLPVREATEDTEAPTWTLVSPDRKKIIRFLIPEDADVDHDASLVYYDDHPPVRVDNDTQDIPSSPASSSIDDDGSAPGVSMRLSNMPR
ncbi:uncharacterized protein STEHIDRAFT_155293 [Stereum hirsutum FP-91666 SS1]|uniref:uncharacterized protein n=1 Tax=Stereum hirsutum (strain FP-91666) TaxID=721885 RepID=UPI000440CF6C|nr:uncharacterized protein STEHIDRAFT_155293 [Stereum hirsutum FP-91666 SS1]EIM87933.1 hypothetical protein STEHIDRAFT_155293 [Stereum hirsutum FP-91666 SS1]